MMWELPAKTFLIGEYAAITGGSALLITSNPCFKLHVTEGSSPGPIHPNSPAGLWWRLQNIKNKTMSWFDPYSGAGGLGASSAQFLGSYLASCSINHTVPSLQELIEAYHQVAYSGQGIKPSGYDVIAQSQRGCVFINRRNEQVISYEWPFEDLSFTLIHTGVKLATHEHLRNTALPDELQTLSSIADKAHEAFKKQDSNLLVHAVNDYQKQLQQLNLVAKHTETLIKQLRFKYPELLSIKGCGALGADVILLLTQKEQSNQLRKKLTTQKWSIVSTEEHLYLKNNKI